MTDNNRYLDIIDCLTRFRRKMGGVSVDIAKETFDHLARIEDGFADGFGVKLSLAERKSGSSHSRRQ